MKILCVISAICAVALGCYEPSLVDKIVGGVEAAIEDSPYVVSVEYKNKHNCGGCIIDDTTIVTAAHCVNKINAKDLRIRVGNTNHKRGKKYAVKKVTPHEKYDRNTYQNDIAILKLSENLDFDSTTQPIELAETGTDPGTKATVSGWGVTSEDSDEIPDDLRKVVVEVISNDNCSKSYESLERKVTSDMMCTLSEGKDACDHDSGGPLVDDDGKLIGIVSWGAGCARPEYPRVYANVFVLSTWISKHK